MVPAKHVLKNISRLLFFCFIISPFFTFGIHPSYATSKGFEQTVPNASSPAFEKPLNAIARSPNAYRFISQHDTAHPTVYCAPTVLAMAFSPFVADSTKSSPAHYVESFAKELGTCPRSGTTVLQILERLNHFNTQDALAQEWDAVWYQGIHKVPTHYYHNKKHQAQWASLNTDVLNVLNAGGLVMAHLGWYIEDSPQKRFLRKGGHYVLVTAVYESPDAKEHHYIELMDPLDSNEAFQSRTPRYVLDLRPLSEAKRAFKVVDPDKQFRPHQVGQALFQPTPPPGKKDEVMTFLEGFVVLTKKP
jgi:hypothetical protein